jgi:hypothetical protein
LVIHEGRLSKHDVHEAHVATGPDEAGKLINISFWETREHMEDVARGTAAGIHDQGIEAAGLTSPRLETYQVKMHV